MPKPTRASAGSGFHTWIEWLACVAVATAGGVALFESVSGQPLLGWDTFPEIETSRIGSFRDFVDTFGEQTAEGYYPAAFYRPVFNLLLAGGYALWGVEPIGFQALGAALVALCGIALFGLSRALHGSHCRTGPWTSLIVFLLLPVHAEVVPLVSRQMDPLCLLFSLLALWTALRAPRSSWVPALFTLLAVGSKEIGVLLPPLVFLVGWSRCDPAPAAIRLRRGLRLAAPHALAVAGVFAARFAALGELGGHSSTSVFGSFTRLGSTLGSLAVTLSGLWSTADKNPSPWLLSSLALLLGVAALASLWALLSAQGRNAGPERRGTSLALGLGLAWLIGCAWIYAASGFVQPWHHLLPGAAAALAVGAAAQSLARGRAGPRRWAATIGLSCIALWASLQAHHSPIFHDYGHWHRGGEVVEAYLQGLSLRIAGQNPGDVISVGLPPNWKPAEANPSGARLATLLAVYSLPAWAKLHFPERSIEFRHEMLASNSAAPDPNKIVVLVRRGSSRSGTPAPPRRP